MVIQAKQYTEDWVHVGAGRMRLLQGGTGTPLLILPTDVGTPGWLPFYQHLAENHTVYVPSHPGYDGSDVPDWARDVRDLAQVHLWLLKTLQLSGLPVVGLGFGGWIAAEMATMNHTIFNRIVLVGAVGVQPSEGEIKDQFMVGAEEWVKDGFHNLDAYTQIYGEQPTLDEREIWELNREMTTRVAWSPYMYSQSLPYLLPSIDQPTLIVWGNEDTIVPQSCAYIFQQQIPNARLEIVPNSGHFVDAEQPQTLATLVRDFVAK
jgi:pimeloyl-ACP methyl ester carboxylesterase